VIFFDFFVDMFCSVEDEAFPNLGKKRSRFEAAS
jgi:hypothetical protein